MCSIINFAIKFKLNIFGSQLVCHRTTDSTDASQASHLKMNNRQKYAGQEDGLKVHILW